MNALGQAFHGIRRERGRRLARPLNVIHRQLSFKFDFFPFHDDHGGPELDRRQHVFVGTLDQDLVVVGVFRMESGRMNGPYIDVDDLCRRARQEAAED